MVTDPEFSRRMQVPKTRLIFRSESETKVNMIKVTTCLIQEANQSSCNRLLISHPGKYTKIKNMDQFQSPISLQSQVTHE